MSHYRYQPRVVLLDSSLGAMALPPMFGHYRPRFGRRLFRFAMLAGFLYLMLRFWFVPVGFIAAAVTAFALRRLFWRARRARRVEREILSAPPPATPVQSELDKKIEAELDALERPWRE